jgi:hypothetical protein
MPALRTAQSGSAAQPRRDRQFHRPSPSSTVFLNLARGVSRASRNGRASSRGPAMPSLSSPAR